MRVRSIAGAAAVVRDRRLVSGMSQSELATQSGQSRKWISESEAVKTTAEFGLVIRVPYVADRHPDGCPPLPRLTGEHYTV